MRRRFTQAWLCDAKRRSAFQSVCNRGGMTSCLCFQMPTQRCCRRSFLN
jgi:hypothetical protein